MNKAKVPRNNKMTIVNYGGIETSDIMIQWIHKDDRGEVVCFYENDIEYTILTTKKGFARGGCIHRINKEHFVVLKGVVLYRIYYEDGVELLDSPTVYHKGQGGIVPHNRPHLLIALEDSITLEWGATTEEKKVKDPRCRAIVDHINSKRSEEGL